MSVSFGVCDFLPLLDYLCLLLLLLVMMMMINDSTWMIRNWKLHDWVFSSLVSDGDDWISIFAVPVVASHIAFSCCTKLTDGYLHTLMTLVNLAPYGMFFSLPLYPSLTFFLPLKRRIRCDIVVSRCHNELLPITQRHLMRAMQSLLSLLESPSFPWLDSYSTPDLVVRVFDWNFLSSSSSSSFCRWWLYRQNFYYYSYDDAVSVTMSTRLILWMQRRSSLVFVSPGKKEWRSLGSLREPRTSWYGSQETQASYRTEIHWSISCLWRWFCQCCRR